MAFLAQFGLRLGSGLRGAKTCEEGCEDLRQAGLGVAVSLIKDEGGRTAISQLPSGESYYPQARREDGLFVNVVYLLHFTIFHCRSLPYMLRRVGELVTVDQWEAQQ